MAPAEPPLSTKGHLSLTLVTNHAARKRTWVHALTTKCFVTDRLRRQPSAEANFLEIPKEIPPRAYHVPSGGMVEALSCRAGLQQVFERVEWGSDAKQQS